MNWDVIRQRYEGWWEHEKIDHPLLRVTAPTKDYRAPVPPEDQAGLFAWLTDPKLVIPRLEGRIAATFYAGDAFPWADPMSQGLAAIQAAYLGAPYHVDAETLTGWADPLLTGWTGRFMIAPDRKNPWWQATLRLLDDGARVGKDRWCAAIPDLQGGGEVLALLRGSEALALDLRDFPEMIVPAIAEINAAWKFYFDACYAAIHAWQEGFIDWLGIWSDLPAATVECDFMVMVSPGMFERFFLPGVEEQVRMVKRSIFHLDGPGAVKHLDLLLSISRLRAIQWVPTPERPSPLDWLPLLRRIQAAGKGVVLACAPAEVASLLNELDPNELILTTECETPQDAEELVRQSRRRCE
jgi:hypothetical protein